MGYRNYAPANGFIVDKKGNGDFTTITAALIAASSASFTGDIFISPGTYTENPALVANVNLVGFGGDGITPAVTIIGKCSFSSAGSVTISNIRLQTNSDFFLAVTGSVASKVYLNNCYLNITNNTGISYTSSSASSYIGIYNCTGNIGTTGIALISASGAGAPPGLTSEGVIILNTIISNNGSSTTANTTSACNILLVNSQIFNPFSTSSTGALEFRNSSVSVNNLNVTAVTTAGSGVNKADLSEFNSGTASAISIGTGTQFTITNCTMQSSNTNIVTGLGTLLASGISSYSTGNSIDTTTQTARPFVFCKSGGTGTPTSTSLYFYEEGTFIPTLTGASTAGSTTYVAQQGYYIRVGSIIYVSGFIQISAATGTGNATIGAFPFTIKNQSNYFPRGTVLVNSTTWTWPASTTMNVLQLTPNSTNAIIACVGSGVASATLQMNNSALALTFSGHYQI